MIVRVKDLWERKGVLKITFPLLQELDIDLARRIFSKLIIIETESHHFPGPTIDYKCICSEFDPVSEGEKIPIYLIETTERKNDKPLIKFIKENKK